MGYKSRSTIAKIEGGENDISQTKIKQFAKVLHTTVAYLMDWKDNSPLILRIPVLGRVVAGIPLEAIENIEGYEDIDLRKYPPGQYFGLKVMGRSMEPRLLEGDIVICRRQDTIESGDIAIVLVNGNEATIKQVKLGTTGITLIGFNPIEYAPHFYTNAEIANMPVQIIARVMEARHTF